LLWGKLLCAPFVVEHIAFGNAHARLVRLEVLGSEELHWMGGNHRQAEFGGELGRGMDVTFLVGKSGFVRKSGTLDFEVITVVKQARPFLCELSGLCRITG
jgi:hypothetical protein